MKMKIRNKAAFTDEVTPLEEENAQVSYEAALEGIVLLEKRRHTSDRTGQGSVVRSGGRHDHQRRDRIRRSK